jgi:predicted HTH domain antitoxin
MSIVIPDEIVQSTRLTQAEFVQELAIALYQRLALTLGEASRLAGLNQWQFQQLLGARNIQIHYGVADFDTDLKTLNELRIENNEHTSKRLSDQLADAIESSQSILELTDNWDEEGSPGYEESTWLRATNFISSIALSFRQTSGFWIDPPRILKGASIFIGKWKIESF